MRRRPSCAPAAKLCADILGAAADGGLDVDQEASAEVLGDALRLLACSHIKARRLSKTRES